jgi:type II secretion system protein G
MKNQKGFTLIEIMIVIAILAMLAGIVVTSIGSQTETAKKATTQTQLSMIDSALEMFRADFGKIPSGGSDPKESFKIMVRILTNKEECANWLISEGEHITGVDDPIFVEKWHGPYLKQKDPNKILDGWHNPLNYQQGIGGNPDDYAVWSDGKNTSDPSDDIYSPSSTVPETR